MGRNDVVDRFVVVDSDRSVAIVYFAKSVDNVEASVNLHGKVETIVVCGIIDIALAIRLFISVDILSEHSPLDEGEVLVDFLFEKRIGTVGETAGDVLLTFEGGETFGARLLLRLSL